MFVVTQILMNFFKIMPTNGNFISKLIVIVVIRIKSVCESIFCVCGFIVFVYELYHSLFCHIHLEGENNFHKDGDAYEVGFIMISKLL